jgi:hypothetical protein
MEQIAIGKSGLMTSRIRLGTWAMGGWMMGRYRRGSVDRDNSVRYRSWRAPVVSISTMRAKPMPLGLSQGGMEVAVGAGFGSFEAAGASGVDGFVACASRAVAGFGAAAGAGAGLPAV